MFGNGIIFDYTHSSECPSALLPHISAVKVGRYSYPVYQLSDDAVIFHPAVAALLNAPLYDTVEPVQDY